MIIIIVMIRDGKGVVWQQSLPEMVQDTADHPPHPFLSSSSSSPSPKSSSPPPSTSKSSSFLRNVQVVTQRVGTGEIANAHAYISSGQKFQTRRDDVLIRDKNHDDDDSQHHHIFEYKAMGPKKNPDPPDLEAVIGRVSDSLREDHL